MPSLKWQKRRTLREQREFFRRILSIAIEWLVKVDDGGSQAEGLYEKGVVSPAGPRVFAKCDVMLLQEATPIER